MSTDALRHHGRVRPAAAAAKARREKIALVVGAVILAGLLAFEGPKTLKSLQHSSTATSEATPTVTTPAAPAAPPHHPVSLRALRGYSAKDPFVPQLASASSGSGPAAQAAVPPRVRTSDFVEKDPFVPQQAAVTVSSPSSGGGSSKTTRAASAGGGYIVMLASVYLGRGRGAAEHAAAAARAHRVPDVHIVLSSEYPTLRTGFYAVYSGPYSTLDKALGMLQEIRGRGYVSAYTRRLSR